MTAPEENQALSPVGLSGGLLGKTILASRCPRPQNSPDRLRQFSCCCILILWHWWRIANNSCSLLQNVSFIVRCGFRSELIFHGSSFGSLFAAWHRGQFLKKGTRGYTLFQRSQCLLIGYDLVFGPTNLVGIKKQGLFLTASTPPGTGRHACSVAASNTLKYSPLSSGTSRENIPVLVAQPSS
jgi:hypothetical protein